MEGIYLKEEDKSLVLNIRSCRCLFIFLSRDVKWVSRYISVLIGGEFGSWRYKLGRY